MGFLTVSQREKKASRQAAADMVAMPAHGRKYGYLFRKELSPNIQGNCLAGWDSEPPINGPS